MDWRIWITPAAASIFLVVVVQYNFLAFHVLAELVAIVISFTMFALAWSTYEFSKNSLLIFLACGFFWIGSLDLIHTLAYKGMNVFAESNGNLSVQFWLAARYSQALLLLAAPFAATRTQNKYLLTMVFGAIAVGLTTMISMGKFPTGFVEGKGLTEFKVYSEYLIVFILALALIFLFRFGRNISSVEKTLIGAAIVMTMCAELAFTFYVDVYGLSVLAGHIFKIFSFWFIFQAIVIVDLRKSYSDLKTSRDQIVSALKILSHAVEQSSATVIITDSDGAIEYVNRKFTETTGYSAEEVFGKNPRIMRSGHTSQSQYAELWKTITSGKEWRGEFHNKRKDGSLYWESASISPIKTEDGAIAHFLGIKEDITERKLADQLRQEQERIIDQSPFISFLWKNAEGWPVEFVSKNIRSLGYDPEDFYSGRIVYSDLIHPDDLKRTAEEVKQYAAEGRDHFVQEYRTKTANGDYKWTDDRTWVRRDDHDNITHFQGIVFDITERKKAEENLLANELQIKRERDQAQQYLDVSPVMFCVLDERGDIVLLNQKGCQLLGYDESEILNKNWFELLIPSDIREEVAGAFSQLMAGEIEGVEYFENILITKSGEARVFSFHNSVIGDEKSDISGVLFSAEDITERMVSEEALLSANKALRTISKANEALVHATTEEQLLHDINRTIVDEGGFRMAWIGVAENDAEKTIRPVSHYGYEQGYLETIDDSWGDASGRGNGPAGTACREGRPVIISNIQDDPAFQSRRASALERGYFSAIYLPLLQEGEPIGVFSIYSGKTDAFTQDNIPLLVELAQDLAFGLKALRNRKIQEQNEETLWWDVAVDQALMVVSQAILQENNTIDDIASLILDQVLTLTKSQFGFVGYIDPATGFLVCPTFTGDIWEECQVENKRAVFEKFTGLFGWVLNNKQALLTNDPRRDPRSTGVPPGHLPIEKFLGIPALIGDQLLGEIAVANPVADYGERDRYLLERVADFYVLAIQQMRSVERLKKSEQHNRLLMDSTGEGIYAIDSEMKCTICNLAALALLGYDSPEAVIGKNMHDLIHHTRSDGSHFPNKECQIYKTLHDGTSLQIEDEVFWRADKSKFRVSYKSNPIVQDGVISGAVISFTDITERLEAEQQLWQSQKVESIGNLAGGIAHDINNMLLPIEALTEMTLKDMPKDSRAHKRLEKVLEASEQAKNLVSRILTFSRKEEPKVERVNIAKTIRSVMGLLRSAVPTTLTIKTQIKNVGDVMADVSQINAVLLNLGSNAADAMEGRVGNLTISLAGKKASKMDAALPPIEEGKLYAVLRVKDNGCGMDENILPRVFDPFFTTKAPGEGTGLGLSIVHGTIAKHGGAIRVNSMVGRGTTFEIFLPIID